MTSAALVGEAAVMAAVCGAGLLALWWVRRQPPPRPSEGPVRAMGDLLAELKRTSDAMAASLDRRAADLRTLIAEADRRLARIEEVRREAPAEAPAAEPDGELRPVFEQVYAMADAGKPLTEISRETQLNKGSIQLILGLREMQKAADGGPGPSGPPRG